jgi:RimJ/RimL family protein N-acetyltransferase
MDTEQTLGPKVDGPAAQPPGAVVLDGRFGRVERLDPARHGADLCRVMDGRVDLWFYTPYGPFRDAAAVAAWLDEINRHEDRVVYAILDRDGRALGLAALMNMLPKHRSIEVGQIVLSPVLQRTPLATEAQYLLARYAFETLGYRRYEWKCNDRNEPSKRAALRLGFRFEGIFRNHQIVKGHSRDTAWYAMLDSEWPARKHSFERWLSPDNFDAQGRQRVSLTALNRDPDARSGP